MLKEISAGYLHPSIKGCEPLLQKTEDKQRFYFAKNGNAYPSVTTILAMGLPPSPELQRWQEDKGIEKANAIRDMAAHYGAMMHHAIGVCVQNGFKWHTSNSKPFVTTYLKNMGVRFSLDGFKHFEKETEWVYKLNKHIMSFCAFVGEHELTPLGVEVPLYSTNLQVAGCCDFLAQVMVNGTPEVWLIDFKSSEKGYVPLKHKCQVNFYAYMLWEQLGIKVDKMVLWSPKDWVGGKQIKPTYTSVEVDPMDFANLSLIRRMADFANERPICPAQSIVLEIGVFDSKTEFNSVLKKSASPQGTSFFDVQA